MKKSKFRGYETEWKDGQFLFCDTGEPTVSTWEQRPCGYCGKHNTPEGHDGCLGTLPEDVVMNACCGHGEENEAYVQYWNGISVHGFEAVKEINRLKTT